MKASNIRRAVLVIVASGTLALGCELLVDFDRTKIAVEGSDAAGGGTGDGSTDAAGDTNQTDAPQADAAADTFVPTDAAAGDADPDAADAADGD